MRTIRVLAGAAIAATLAATPAAAIKKLPYGEVKLDLAERLACVQDDRVLQSQHRVDRACWQVCR